MDNEKIISDIAKRGNNEIYLGVVGAVRTGKSTFIKRFIENLVVPNITDEYEKSPIPGDNSSYKISMVRARGLEPPRPCEH